jgi:hypothetical protein
MYIRHNMIFVLFYRQEKDAGTEKVEKKSRESKDIVPPTRRSQHICDPTNVVDENNSGHGVQVDIAHGDVEADIAHGVVQRDDFLAKILKEIIDQHGKKGRASLEMLNVMYY